MFVAIILFEANNEFWCTYSYAAARSIPAGTLVPKLSIRLESGSLSICSGRVSLAYARLSAWICSRVSTSNGSLAILYDLNVSSYSYRILCISILIFYWYIFIYYFCFYSTFLYVGDCISLTLNLTLPILTTSPFMSLCPFISSLAS